MLLDRLRVLEDALSQNTYDNLLCGLVNSKIRLAEADYTITELKGLLYKEKDRNRKMAGLLSRFNVDCDALFGASLSATSASPSFTIGSLWRFLGY